MRIKLDENVHGDVVPALLSLGHDVKTANEQSLGGRSDAEIAAVIRDERRCLVTFDLDFADPRRFPPREFSGLIVLRLRFPTATIQVRRVADFLESQADVNGRLWILDELRARDWSP